MAGEKELQNMVQQLKAAGVRVKMEKRKTISKDAADKANAFLEREVGDKIKKLGVKYKSPAKKKKKKGSN